MINIPSVMASVCENNSNKLILNYGRVLPVIINSSALFINCKDFLKVKYLTKEYFYVEKDFISKQIIATKTICDSYELIFCMWIEHCTSALFSSKVTT